MNKYIVVIIIILISLMALCQSKFEQHEEVITHDMALAKCEMRDLIYDYETGECYAEVFTWN